MSVSEQKGGVLVPLIKAGVSLALLGVLFSRVDFGRLWQVAKSASLPWLSGALALYYLMIAVSAWRRLPCPCSRPRSPHSSFTNSARPTARPGV